MNLYTGLLHLHNVMRWVILILLLVAIFKAFTGMNSRQAYNNGDKKVSLFLMISAHITLLIGLYQWIVGPWGLRNIQSLGFGEVMKNGIHRFWAIEHLTGMLIAIILITIGKGVGKKNIPDASKHKKAFWFFLIALFIILLTVPWPFREGIGRPLLPGQHESI
jgi:hypothetical protein